MTPARVIVPCGKLLKLSAAADVELLYVQAYSQTYSLLLTRHTYAKVKVLSGSGNTPRQADVRTEDPCDWPGVQYE